MRIYFVLKNQYQSMTVTKAGKVFPYKSVIIILILFNFLVFPVFGDTTKTIVDITGTEVTIPEEITNGVILDPFSGLFVALLGAEDKLAGACIVSANENVLSEISPVLANTPSGGCTDSVKVEKLEKREADVVFSTVDYPTSNERIAETEYPLVILDIEGIDELMKSYEILGEAFNKEDRAEEFINYYEDKLAEIRTQIGSESEKKVYFADMDSFTTVGRDYYQSDLVKSAGGTNVATETSGEGTVTIDQIEAWDPDVIICFASCEESVDDLLNDPTWQNVRAVQEGNVYRMPHYIMTYDTPGPESVLGAVWLAKTLHPDSVTLSVTDEMIDFYNRFFDKTLTSEDAEAILNDNSVVSYY